MALFKRKPMISRAAAMASVPLKNERVEEVQLESGDLLLTYPIPVRPWIEALIRRKGTAAADRQRKKLQLDTLGAAVWKLLDGHRSVRQVVDAFAGQYQLHSREAEVSVTQFLRELGKRGLIGLK
jgi:hypothetical protein